MTLVDKSVDACLAAIEIYNKPSFSYREEAFSILMLNAWELLLKARVMRENSGSTKAIEVWEPRRRPDGTRTNRLFAKKNRSQNAMTIGLDRAVALVREFEADSIDDRCIENLGLLTEIRDNSIHLWNIDAGLGQRIQQVGAAALKNYVHAVESWFGVDLSRFNFYLMPLAFYSPAEIVEALRGGTQTAGVKNVLELIARAEQQYPSEEQRPFNVSMKIELKFVRTVNAEAIAVRVVRDPAAPVVQLREEDIRQAYPWDYGELTQRLSQRYSDFSQNREYHRVRRRLEADERLCRVRYLDPARPVRSSSKRFYSPNILMEFDEFYTRR